MIFINNIKDEFIGLNGVSYLYTGAEGPSLKKLEESFKEYLLDKSLGEIGRERALSKMYKAKENIAKMIKAKVNEITFLGNTSEAICTVIESLQLQPGDNIVVTDMEYPSLVLPLVKLLSENNFEIKIVKSNNGAVHINQFHEHINEHTKAVIISHVSFVNGYRIDLEKLNEITKEKNVLLIADTTQSLGVCEVESAHFDIMVASSYKWLLTPHGLGILYISENLIEKLNPQRVGWRSVQDLFSDKRFTEYQWKDGIEKFEVGYVNFPSIYALKSSTDFLLQNSIPSIQRHVLNLGNLFIQECKQIGYKILTPEDPSVRSGNISIQCENAEEIAKHLERQKIHVWGGAGRIRTSIHLFNDESDIENLLNALYGIKSKEGLHVNRK